MCLILRVISLINVLYYILFKYHLNSSISYINLIGRLYQHNPSIINARENKKKRKKKSMGQQNNNHKIEMDNVQRVQSFRDIKPTTKTKWLEMSMKVIKNVLRATSRALSFCF